MVAADIAPTFVMELPAISTKRTGTPIRTRTFLFKIAKVTQNDWVTPQADLGFTDITGKIIDFHGVTKDSSNDYVQETLTYTDTGDKLTMTSATVGTTYLVVTVQAE